MTDRPKGKALRKPGGKKAGAAPPLVPQGQGKRLPAYRPLLPWIGLAVLLALTIVALWPAGKAPSLPGAAPPGALPTQEDGQAPASPERPPATLPPAMPAASGPPILASVWLTPAQPTRNDAIQAKVRLQKEDGTGVTYDYQWKVNGREIEGATGDTLAGSSLKRSDRVSVVVRARREGVWGPPWESPFVVVHGILPTLEMETPRSRFAQGQPIEIQLTSVHPDDDRVAFALASPYVEGMDIDARTGKITWTPPRIQGGTLRFGASVTDGVGNKVTKIFELVLGVETGGLDFPGASG